MGIRIQDQLWIQSDRCFSETTLVLFDEDPNIISIGGWEKDSLYIYYFLLCFPSGWNTSTLHVFPSLPPPPPRSTHPFPDLNSFSAWNSLPTSFVPVLLCEPKPQSPPPGSHLAWFQIILGFFFLSTFESSNVGLETHHEWGCIISDMWGFSATQPHVASWVRAKPCNLTKPQVTCL